MKATETAQRDFFDPSAAQAARDEGIARIAGNNGVWIDGAIAAFKRLDMQGEVTGEQVRVELTKVGVTEPKHHNAWGALIRSLALLGHLIETGRHVKAQREKSHARRTVVWRVGR